MIPLIFLAILGGLSLYLLVTLFDLLLSQAYKKQLKLWPCTRFMCLCGADINLLPGPMIPICTYDLIRVRKHMKGCLLWIMHVEFNGLTPYFGTMYMKDLINKDAVSTILDDWHLKYYQRKSILAKKGRDPFKDDPEFP